MEIIGDQTSAAERLRIEWASSLDEHMKAQGLRRKALRQRLAEFDCYVTEQAIGCWLRAETAPRPEHQAALAAVFRVPTHRLFPIESPAPRAS